MRRVSGIMEAQYLKEEKNMEKFTISRDDSVYEAFPDVALTKSGKLVCVFTECNHHADRKNSRIVLKTSCDRGRSWTEKRPLTERSVGGMYHNCARISRLSDGRLAIVCDMINGENTADFDKTVIKLWLSTDEGESWSEPMIIPGAHGIVPDRLVELKSGRWLVSAHRPSAEHGKLAEYLRYSDDQGKTWSEEVIVASDARYNLCEASLLEAAPDTVVAYLRENSVMGYDCLKAISRDGGRTWNGVYNVPLPGCHRPTAGFLRDGRILITYRFMQGGKGWLGTLYQNTFGAILPPESALAEKRNDQWARIFPIDFDRSHVSDSGYTGWVQFDDGEIYVVNYIVDNSPKAFIKGYSFRAEEFLI